MEVNKNNSNTNASNSTSKTNAATDSNTSQNAQSRSNQQATSGKGGLKDIQGKLKQYGSTAANTFNKMTTTQKAAVGGAALALGAGWLALNSKNKNKVKSQVSSAAAVATDKLKEVNKSITNAASASQKQNTSGNSPSATTNARVK